MKLDLPNRAVRRVVIAPAMVIATTILLASSPLVILVLAFAVRFLPGRWRPLRLFWFLLVYLVRETVGLFALLFMWVVSGFGAKLDSDRFQRAHIALIGWYLRGLIGSAARVLGLVVLAESVPGDLALNEPLIQVVPGIRANSESPGDEQDSSEDGERPRPVLVFSRHAGAGDSFLLAHLAVNLYGRRPRIVLKDLLQLDPCIDVVLNRLPNRFISPNPPPGSGVISSIRELAGSLEDDGALILFPEGGNFSERRRLKAIAKLEKAGLHESAERAQELTYVLPPRPGGAFAAIDSCPTADVLFVAHTGLEQLSSIKDLWNGLPMDREVRIGWWHERQEDIPTGEEERIRWLYEWWERIDTWIENRRDPDLAATPLLTPIEDGSETDIDAQAPSV